LANLVEKHPKLQLKPTYSSHFDGRTKLSSKFKQSFGVSGWMDGWMDGLGGGELISSTLKK
jgi:hypothetical protein